MASRLRGARLRVAGPFAPFTLPPPPPPEGRQSRPALSSHESRSGLIGASGAGNGVKASKQAKLEQAAWGKRANRLQLFGPAASQRNSLQMALAPARIAAVAECGQCTRRGANGVNFSPPWPGPQFRLHHSCRPRAPFHRRTSKREHWRARSAAGWLAGGWLAGRPPSERTSGDLLKSSSQATGTGTKDGSGQPTLPVI